jgi:saccharopepsin
MFIKNLWQMHYLVNVSVGTPPQVFQLALQTGPTLPLVIPSARCAPTRGCDGSPSNRYNSSLSSTYKPGRARLFEEYNGLVYEGNGSQDTVSIGNITVRELEFLEWTAEQRTTPGIFNWEYDGLVSLAPPWYRSNEQSENSGLPSLLSALDAQNDLDAKIFSLELNKTQNGTGKLIIGANDDLLHDKSTAKLPIVDYPDTILSGLWTTPIKSMTIQFESYPSIELPFPGNYTALFNPGSFRTTLPRTYGLEFLKLTPARRVQWINMVDCASLDTLPDLLFTFEHNQTVKITPQEYVLKMEILREPHIELCTIAIDDTSEHEDLPDDVAVFGSSFLRAFHSIWDWENRTIGRK